MNCIFCNKICVEYSSIDMYGDLSHHECDTCNTYYHDTYHNIWSQKLHIACTVFNNSEIYAQVVNLNGDILFKCYSPININPSNIDEKLKLYLTFS